MKDRRVTHFRGQLEALVEALAATVRISRWTGAEIIPEPLQKSAAQLNERLGATNRLASDTYVGPTPVVSCLTAMSGAAKRLDAAYVDYRHRITTSPAQRDEAAIALDAEIDGVKADSHNWM